ncbi:unnamed protein product [Schistosoma turkestanicum]|nr:unnamed protein product [Schistosoma turkestanicum]
MMMDHVMNYASKSPEKSSPSFPEDVEDDDEDPMDLEPLKYSSLRQHINNTNINMTNNNTTHNTTHNNNETNNNHCNGGVIDDDDDDNVDEQLDVTMLPLEDEDDEINGTGGVGGGGGGGTTTTTHGFMLGIDSSPRHPIDSTEKKVHWSNQNVQTLLDCVEKHLDEFNIQKKHKQVWQIIGTEMESLGFTMEHCYNKWKNLRRDVRLLVNNPQKAVRNADILRRVARLILVIYPNIDATTMQVTGDRINSTSKSTPNTPGGPGSLSSSAAAAATRLTLSASLHAPDSPLYFGLSRTPRTPHSLTPNFHSFNGIKPKTEQSNYDNAMMINTTPNANILPTTSTTGASTTTTTVPGTALFTNSNSNNHNSRNSDNDKKLRTSSTPNSINNNTNNTHSAFPFMFNPAATAALLVQSQLFNDLLRHQPHQTPPPPPSSSSLLHDMDSIQLDSIQQREQFMALTTSIKNALHGGSGGTITNGNSNGVTLTQHTTTNNNNSSSGMNVSKSGITNGDFNADSNNNNSVNNPLHIANLATNLLNGLTSMDTSQYLNLLASEAGLLNGSGSSSITSHVNNYHHPTASHLQQQQQPQQPQPLYTSITDRLPPGSELASVVQRLLNEETIHLRLTDMVTHLADELRAAGLRRRATLDQLLEIMQGGGGGGGGGVGAGTTPIGGTTTTSTILSHTHNNPDTPTHRV